jgi:hypothetical protein
MSKMTTSDHYPIARFADWVRKYCTFVDAITFRPQGDGMEITPVWRYCGDMHPLTNPMIIHGPANDS